ncbi:MAG: TrmB family transcriptional regulator [Phascolarctobacterium sp.]|nr:TrmB family transcriptional regulator [Phascolarctobacterium sp.]MBR1975687.1 TrmB family transcriptional regulator [Phascolarctobacterium sp.]MBR2140248.1 TrmB family transcriptional regulator [Phascolarctobacterium sp.]MDO5474511.1 helix-turn-helix domain-containing protein [Phascolarctobacterium sp.]
MELIEGLTHFNLTKQEATLYVLLLKEGYLTGYEAAKQTGISRSNTYTALAGLVEKGAAYVLEEGKVTRYTPVAPEEFCTNKIDRLQEIKQKVLSQLPVLKSDAEGYITIKGELEIINKLKNTVRQAEARIYVSANKRVMELLKSELVDALDRGLKVVIISDKQFTLPQAICYGTEKQNEQIRLIADSQTVVTGDLEDEENSTCLYSCKRNLVDLFKDALKNEIKLIELQKGDNRG